MVSEIQSVLFRKDYFTQKEAEDWLHRHNKKPMDFEVTSNFYRYSLQDPKRYDKIRTRVVNKNGQYYGINLLIGFDPKDL